MVVEMVQNSQSLHSFTFNAVKVLVNEDALLPMMFFGLRTLYWEAFVADTKSVSEQNQKHFLCPGYKICVRNKCCARGQKGKHLCRQQCVLVC